MSYWENEFVGILDYIDSLFVRYRNMEFIADVIREASLLRKRVPILPGIVAMCLGSVTKEIKPEEIEQAQKYLFVLEEEEIYGVAEKVSGDSVSVSGKKIGKNMIIKTVKINASTLEEIWPTLVYEVKER